MFANISKKESRFVNFFWVLKAQAVGSLSTTARPLRSYPEFIKWLTFLALWTM